MDKLPTHIKYTKREWKHKKRQELKAAIKAMDILRGGMFFTPDKGEFNLAYQQLEKLKDKMSVAKWKTIRGE
jgi:hypothetical protein